jgi:hypothetical protein
VFLTIRNLAPKLPPAFERVVRPFRTFLDVKEAEALLQDHKHVTPASAGTIVHRLSKGRSLVFAALGLCQVLVWSSVFWFLFITLPVTPPGGEPTELFATAFVSGLAWTYATLRAVMHPTTTPPYDLFTIYCLLFLRAIESVGVAAYQSYVYERNLFSYGIELFASLLNITVLTVLLALILNMPIAIPGDGRGITKEVIGTKVSPEDYTTLWNWIGFGWVTPLTKRESLFNEDDVWDLSPLMATRAIYTKYAEVGKAYQNSSGKVTPSSFFWHWWACNSLDIILEFGLSMLSIALEFSSPLFLKLILECIASLGTEISPVEARKLRAQALIWAFAAFVCSVVKAGSDLHHLFYGRRAATRTRNEIMVAIYDKALRRRDVIAPPTTADTKKDGEKGGAKAANSSSTPVAGGEDARKVEEAGKKKKEDDKKNEGADLGKLVNLMSTDTRTLERWVYMVYWFYVSIACDETCRFDWFYRALLLSFSSRFSFFISQ